MELAWIVRLKQHLLLMDKNVFLLLAGVALLDKLLQRMEPAQIA